MKKLVIICSALFIAYWGVLIPSAGAKNESQKPESANVQTRNFEGIFFSTANVVDCICYGTKERDENNAYYVIYDDIDAAWEYVAIPVDVDTYELALRFADSGESVCGHLQRNYESEKEQYSLIMDFD